MHGTRRTILTIGVLLIIAGIFVLNQGIQSFLPIATLAGLTSHTQAENVIVPPTLESIPPLNYTYLTSDLKEGNSVLGTVQVESGHEIGFYVMDEGNFSKWKTGQPASILLAEPFAITYNFTLTPHASGTYFFVFDNQDRDERVFVFNLYSVQDVTVLNPILRYADYELFFVGILIVILGLKTGKSKSSGSNAHRCRFCGANLELGQAFCIKCNRSQI